ncbi:hypothetical protein GCM10010245_51560 [Streptomyces spectabilis]|nr:hypothetical protein GCM10010245_51560 [Streptomyces spectabilis]
MPSAAWAVLVGRAVKTARAAAAARAARPTRAAFMRVVVMGATVPDGGGDTQGTRSQTTGKQERAAGPRAPGSRLARPSQSAFRSGDSCGP